MSVIFCSSGLPKNGRKKQEIALIFTFTDSGFCKFHYLPPLPINPDIMAERTKHINIIIEEGNFLFSYLFFRQDELNTLTLLQ